MYWKKFTSADGDVVLVVGVDLGVLFGRESGEMFEVVNEVGLIVETAFTRDRAPIDLRGRIDRADSFLKPHYLQVRLGRNSDLLAEYLGEVLL